jgi:hypothetical protein
MPGITVQPPVVDISFYAGDGVAFRLVAMDDEDPPAPIDLAGEVEAQIRVDRLAPDPPVVEFSADVTEAAQGIVLLSLTGIQTQALSDHTSSKKGKFTGVWDVEWTAPGTEPRTLCQGKVECLADVTR